MKKLINRPQAVVRESLAGLALAHPDLVEVHYDPTYVLRAGARVPGKVGLVSGGGSGHEPMHAGYVGRGMLDAACPGDIFTSPTPDQIEQASHAIDAGAGVLHIVKNYTGDVMNFEMAAELCRADGLAVEAVVIADDVAVRDSLYTAGRRGVGTTVLAEKICGAAAERGADLQQLVGLCRKVNASGRSIGVALTSCTVPAAGRPTFEIGEAELEFGIGIHGEPGRERLPMQPAQAIVEMMARAVTDDLGLKRGERVIALVNGMGGTPLIELYIVYHELTRICQAMGVGIARRLVGNYITSLEMAGCSITLLRADDELVGLWDDPVHTPALRWGV
jgi:dihydroxyacetone kinase-like protein